MEQTGVLKKKILKKKDKKKTKPSKTLKPNAPPAEQVRGCVYAQGVRAGDVTCCLRAQVGATGALRAHAVSQEQQGQQGQPGEEEIPLLQAPDAEHSMPYIDVLQKEVESIEQRIKKALLLVVQLYDVLK